MSSIKVQKATWVIVVNPKDIPFENNTVEYYTDPSHFGAITTRSYVSANWFDEQRDANAVLKKLKTRKDTAKTFKEAEARRLVIGLQDE